MRNPAVSIIIPVYNASNYIERCAHSLFRQTFDDIEYVFVNDCTTDDSIEKLQKVAEQYPHRKERIKIVSREKNGGVSASRQTGVDNSTGNYILFVDNDDWIKPEMVETMYNKAKSEKADVVICDFIIEKNTDNEYCCGYISANKEDYLYDMVENKAYNAYLWNKLIDRRFFDLSDCRFNENLLIVDDWFALIRIYYYIEKCVKIDEAFYHYNRQNPSAQTAPRTTSKTSAQCENTILFYELIENFLKGKGVYEKHIDIIERLKVESKIDLLTQVFDIKTRKKYAYLYRDIEMKYIKNFRRGERIILFLTRYGFHSLAHLTLLLIIFKNRNNSK